MTIDIRCPHCGQHSTDAEYCSECGSPIAAPDAASAASGGATPPGGNAAASSHCPDCGEPRPGPNVRFCGNCRFDFVTGTSFSPPPVAAAVPVAPDAAADAPDAASGLAAAPAAPAASTPMPSAQGPLPAMRWELLAVVDATLAQPGSPEAPVGEPDRVFPVFDDSLIGRRSERQGIFPEVALDSDVGVSRRHAQITRLPDGALSILDLGSTNGTRVNGADLAPHVPQTLAEGDVVTLGHWTRLTLRGRA